MTYVPMGAIMQYMPRLQEVGADAMGIKYNGEVMAMKFNAGASRFSPRKDNHFYNSDGVDLSPGGYSMSPGTNMTPYISPSSLASVNENFSPQTVAVNTPLPSSPMPPPDSGYSASPSPNPVSARRPARLTVGAGRNHQRDVSGQPANRDPPLDKLEKPVRSAKILDAGLCELMTQMVNVKNRIMADHPQMEAAKMGAILALIHDAMTAGSKTRYQAQMALFHDDRYTDVFNHLNDGTVEKTEQAQN